MNWDLMIQNKFKEFDLSDSICCDVGACKGEFTSLFKNLCGTGKVYSFEINPDNIKQIIYLNSENCIIENMAVSSVDDVIINVYGSDYRSNILGYDVEYNKSELVSTVKSVTLDSYFKDIKVDFLKIDVEGAEYQVISGGINTIKNCKLVVIECHFDEDWEKIYKILEHNNLKFKNLIDDEYVFFGETTYKSGRSSNGRPYQMYLTN